MWPPRPSAEPRLTIAAAFHRFHAVIRDSVARSPGKSGCAHAGTVLMWSVVSRPGTVSPDRAACSCTRRSRYTARSGPAFRTTASRDARHSAVSSASRSGSWSSSLAAESSGSRNGSLMAHFLRVAQEGRGGHARGGPSPRRLSGGGTRGRSPVRPARVPRCDSAGRDARHVPGPRTVPPRHALSQTGRLPGPSGERERVDRVRREDETMSGSGLRDLPGPRHLRPGRDRLRACRCRVSAGPARSRRPARPRCGGRTVSTIAFLNVPLRGHINPTLPVVAELVRRGHTVTYHTTAAFAEETAAAGAVVHLYPGTARRSPVRRRPSRCWSNSPARPSNCCRPCSATCGTSGPT